MPYTPSVETLERYFNFDPANVPEVTLFRGRGCKHCNDTGYRGRIAFHELFLVNNEIRDLIAHGASQPSIHQAAVKLGYRPLRYDGLKKALLGLTTLEEVASGTLVEFE